ncbi:preprotein translocase subunit YajC [Nitratidesulfovibrio vulgaris]|uniref:preprotein translocase subunit YajC n=1 Tax=Nitratidesulfovibrio vulgaris TaxID=881 RepID=UPI0023012BAA|nr:preprotein translocase subunit YajC [Nitratidesulfovibrio vulgaris]WCB45407.1 preprotein translocase subunit YajC [Nitratidesulfovibrio vulgaris]
MLWTTAAYAMGAGQQAGAEGGAAALTSFVPLILMFAIFYFLLIRPQQKRAKEHKAMLDALGKGEHVLTAGGLYGRIVDIDVDTVTLDLGETKVKIGRGFITGVVDPSKKAAPKKSDAKDSK